MALIEKIYENAQSLNDGFANTIAELLTQDIEQHGNASLVVSGGRTPMGLFAALSTKEINWSAVTITLADERWVDEDNADSNANLVKTHLLVNHAKNATFVSLKTPHENAYDAVQDVVERVKAMPRPFTVTILGMGEDGHTASLFPCSKEVANGVDINNQDICLAVTPTTAPHQRMSLTLAEIVASKNIYLHLTGAKKKQVLEQAIEDSATLEPKPIVSVINQADVSLCWAP